MCEHFSPEFFCDHPTATTPGVEAGPWDGEALFTGWETLYPGSLSHRGHDMRCDHCDAAPEPILYRHQHGAWVCGQCAIECPFCAKRPAVVSARRPADDPTAPGEVETVCLECLEQHWDPEEMLAGAWLCRDCDQWHVGDQCPLAYQCMHVYESCARPRREMVS